MPLRRFVLPVASLPSLTCSHKVYFRVPSLQSPRSPPPSSEVGIEETTSNRSVLTMFLCRLQPLFTPLTQYLSSPVALPSLSLSITHLTVLSFSAQMVVYLLSLPYYTSASIGLLRTLSVGVEITATWVAPRLMRKTGSIRAGLWFLNWQLAWVGVAVGAIWGIGKENALLASVGLMVAVIVSRIGLWGFDLCVQDLIQEVRLLSYTSPFPFPLLPFALLPYQNLLTILALMCLLVISDDIRASNLHPAAHSLQPKPLFKISSNSSPIHRPSSFPSLNSSVTRP